MTSHKWKDIMSVEERSIITYSSKINVYTIFVIVRDGLVI